MRTELDWLALVLATESDREEEYPYLAIPILNRVADTKREFKKLKTVRAVVRQPKAFSFFDMYYRTWDDETWFHNALLKYPGKNYEKAQQAAAEALWGTPHTKLLADALFFWAPAAMKPTGSDPVWSKKLRVIQIPGIDRWKFASYPT